MANGIKITEETFEGLSPEDQIVALFRSVERLNVLIENRRWIDKGIAAGTGIGGGFLAVAGYIFF